MSKATTQAKHRGPKGGQNRYYTMAQAGDSDEENPVVLQAVEDLALQAVYKLSKGLFSGYGTMNEVPDLLVKGVFTAWGRQQEAACGDLERSFKRLCGRSMIEPCGVGALVPATWRIGDGASMTLRRDTRSGAWVTVSMDGSPDLGIGESVVTGHAITRIGEREARRLLGESDKAAGDVAIRGTLSREHIEILHTLAKRPNFRWPIKDFIPAMDGPTDKTVRPLLVELVGAGFVARPNHRTIVLTAAGQQALDHQGHVS